MHKLPTKRVLGTKPGIFHMSIPGKGIHHFKRPFPAYLHVMAEYETIILDFLKLSVDNMALVSEDSTDPDPDPDPDRDAKIKALAHTINLKSPMYFRALGVLIGLYWYHTSMALDVKYDAYINRLDDYGDDVIEDLHDSGYTEVEISNMGTAVVVAYMGGRMNANTLTGRVNFLERTPVV